MTQPTEDVLRTAVAVAVHAPSIHNTQPWRWAVRDTGLDLHADPSRTLSVADPDGRALHLSCGAALQHAELALRAKGWDCQVVLLPDERQPQWLATIRVIGSHQPSSADNEMLYAVLWRTSERRPFQNRPIPADVVDRLSAAAHRESAQMQLVVPGPLAEQVAELVSRADSEQRADPAYRAELADWLRTDPFAPDGIPLRRVPHVSDGSRHSDVPLRDLEVAGPGLLEVETSEEEHPTLAVISSVTDGPGGWLSAGQALGHVLLTATVEGLSASPMSQALELPVARRALRSALGIAGYPQAMLRLGYLPPDSLPMPLTPRRALNDVMVQPEEYR